MIIGLSLSCSAHRHRHRHRQYHHHLCLLFELLRPSLSQSVLGIPQLLLPPLQSSDKVKNYRFDPLEKNCSPQKVHHRVVLLPEGEKDSAGVGPGRLPLLHALLHPSLHEALLLVLHLQPPHQDD